MPLLIGEPSACTGVKLVGHRGDIIGCFVFRYPLDAPHREEVVGHLQMNFARGYRLAPVVKISQLDRAYRNARWIYLIDDSKQLFARAMKYRDHDVSGFNFHKQIVADYGFILNL